MPKIPRVMSSASSTISDISTPLSASVSASISVPVVASDSVPVSSSVQINEYSVQPPGSFATNEPLSGGQLDRDLLEKFYLFT